MQLALRLTHKSAHQPACRGLFLGSRARCLREDIPFIFEQTLKKFPGVTYELSPPMMSDPMMIDFVAKHVESALTEPRSN